MYDYFTRLAEERRAEPKEDLVTALAHAEFEGTRVTHEEMLEILVLLLIAGNENTTSLVGNAVVQFLNHPGGHARYSSRSNLACRRSRRSAPLRIALSVRSAHRGASD